jgi:hypothetical protein
MYRIDIEGDIMRFGFDSVPGAPDCLASSCFPECARKPECSAARAKGGLKGMNKMNRNEQNEYVLCCRFS